MYSIDTSSCLAPAAGHAVTAVGRDREPLAVPAPESWLAAAAEVFSKQPPRAGRIRRSTPCVFGRQRLTSILSLIPLWGLWRLSRSDQHTPQEMSLLGAASIGLTILLLLGIWTLVPNADERAQAAHEGVRRQIQVLAGLVEDYRKEHGRLPDDSAWQRSAAGADLRFYDPWGKLYRYAPDGEGFTITTHGRDGVPGGRREDEDVSMEYTAPSLPATPPIAESPASG